MESYFSSQLRQEQLRAILASWSGTPYRHHCGVKQGGTDCIQFVGRVMQEAGALPDPVFPLYPPDWHLHQDEERLLNAFLELVKRGKGIAVDPDEVANGDVVLFKFGKVCSHSAIFMDGQIWQAVSGMGVLRTQYQDGQWWPRRRFAFRFVTQQES